MLVLIGLKIEVVFNKPQKCIVTSYVSSKVGNSPAFIGVRMIDFFV